MQEPKTNAARNRLIENLRRQIDSRKISKENLNREIVNLENKILRLQRQLELQKIKGQDEETQLNSLLSEIKTLESLEFNSQEKQNRNQEIQSKLSQEGYSFEEYQRGLIPPAILKELGLPSIS